MPESYMFFPADLSCSRKNCVRLLLFSLLLNSLVLTAFRARAANNAGEAVRIKAKTARPEPQSGVQTFVRVINQPTNDIVSNPHMGFPRRRRPRVQLQPPPQRPRPPRPVAP